MPNKKTPEQLARDEVVRDAAAQKVADFIEEQKAKNAYYTQVGLARDAGVSPAELSKLLHRKRLLPHAKMARLAGLMGRDVRDLVPADGADTVSFPQMSRAVSVEAWIAKRGRSYAPVIIDGIREMKLRSEDFQITEALLEDMAKLLQRHVR